MKQEKNSITIYHEVNKMFKLRIVRKNHKNIYTIQVQLMNVNENVGESLRV